MWRLGRADGVLGLAAILLGGGLFLLSFGIAVNPGAQTLSARFFPQLLAGGLVGFGALLALRPGARTARQAATGLLVRRALLLAAAIAAYFLLFRSLDFRLGAFLFTLAAMWILGSRRWAELVLVPLAVSLGTYLVFRYGFTVLLPTWT